MAKKKIIVLGSTGSVGRQALAVVQKYPEKFEVVGLSAFSNEALLQDQIEEFRPKFYNFRNGEKVSFQQTLFDFMDSSNSKFTLSLDELATVDCDLLVSAISGIAGLRPVLKALEKGTDVAIANKEAVVCGGDLMNATRKRTGAKLLPLDSEHSAVWQCLFGEDKKNIKKMIITASGGALRDMTKDEIKKISAKEALLHPVWKMGKKVTIDSATLFNKGLEVAEATKLFEIEPSKVSVVMHRESIVHGLVEFSDNSMKASLAMPDMSLPIELAMFYPSRPDNSVRSLDLAKLGSLNFSKPDFDRFPCLEIALDGIKKGSGAMTALSAADEILTNMFIEGEIGFYDISLYLDKVLRKFGNLKASTLEEIMDIDFNARQYILEMVVK